MVTSTSLDFYEFFSICLTIIWRDAKNIIIFISYITVNSDEGWGWGLLLMLYCLSSVVANESTFLQWLSAFSVFWNAFFHMFLSLLYCLLVISLFSSVAMVLRIMEYTLSNIFTNWVYKFIYTRNNFSIILSLINLA